MYCNRKQATENKNLHDRMANTLTGNKGLWVGTRAILGKTKENKINIHVGKENNIITTGMLPPVTDFIIAYMDSLPVLAGSEKGNNWSQFDSLEQDFTRQGGGGGGVHS